jgi:hypothetical protein
MRLGPGLAFLSVAALATLSSGCSALSVYGPSRTQRASIGVSCTDERYAPALDVGLGGASLLSAAFDDSHSTGARVGLATSAVAWGASAAYGYFVTAECRKAKDALHRYHQKLLLRQIDLLNEAASRAEHDDDEAEDDEAEQAPPRNGMSPPPPAPPMNNDTYVPPPP